MPKHVSAGLMFGTALSIPIPDVDRTDYLLILGANPLASNGSLMTAPDMRGRLRAIRERGGKVVVVDPRRSAHRRGGRRAPLHPARHRRAPAVRARHTCSSTRGSPTPGRAGRALQTGSTRCASSRATSRPSGRGGRVRHPGARTSAASRASSPPRRARRRLRPHRHLHAGVRHARELARRRAERAHRQPRPAGRRHVPQPAAGAAQHARRAGHGPRRAARALAEPRARPAGDVRRAPGRLPGRGDRDARRGPDPRAVHDRGQPGRQHAERRPPATALEALDFMVRSTSTSTRPRATPT